MKDTSQTKQGLLGEVSRLKERIAELERAEAAHAREEMRLKAGEAKWREIFQTMEDLYYETDAGGIIRLLSPSVYRLTGWVEDDLIGKPAATVYADAADRERLLAALAEQGYVHDYELPLKRKSGEIRQVSVSASMVTDEAGRPAGMKGLLRDITERKRAQEELTLHAERIETLLQLNQMTAAPLKEITDFALEAAVRLTRSKIGYLAFLNEDESVLTMHSWSKSAMAECAIADKPIDYPVPGAGLWAEAVRQRKAIITNDYSLPNPWKKGYPEGHVRVLRHMNVPVFVESRIVLVAGVGNKAGEYDMTDVQQLTLLMEGMWRLIERKKAEEALRNSRRFLSDLIEHSGALICVKDREGRYELINRRLAEVTGLTRADALGKTDDDLFPGPTAAQFRANDLEAMTTGRTVEREEVLEDGQGKRHFLAVKFPLLGGDGSVTGVCGMMTEITGRKKAEEALSASKTALDLALKSSRMGVWTVDLMTRKSTLDAQSCALLGIDHATFKGTQEEYLAAIDPDDHAKVREALAATIEHDESYEPEYRAVWPDGSIHYLCSRGRVDRDAKGRPQRVHGIIWDITERREMEEALRESRQRFQGLVETLYDWVWEVDADGRYTYVSPQISPVLGYGQDEILGKTLYDLMPAAEAQRVAEELDQLAKERKPIVALENTTIHKDGRLVHLETTGLPFYDAAGNLAGYRGTDRDITGRKRAEERIKSLLAEKELLLREVHHRIKNNMNIIVGVLALQANRLRDPSAVAALKDAGNRVRSMMVLYDKLYRSADFREVSTRTYLASLIDEITAHFPNRDSVEIAVEIDDFALDATTLSSVGMIFNELLTNAMKHAFVWNDRGTIGVSLAKKGTHATLTVWDDGIGIPEHIDIGSSTNFGMQLLRLITKQLKGAIRLERENGTRFVLEFEV